MENKHVLIIGGGVTGMRTAIRLSELGIKSIIIEKESVLGGKVKGYSRLFPDFRDSKALLGELMNNIENSQNIEVFLGKEVSKAIKEDNKYYLTLNGGETLMVDSVIVASGFSLFDAGKIPEYGYGLYPNVINSLEMEKMLASETMLRPYDDIEAKSFAIIFCVGSRNKRLGNSYCSRICCSYSIKQAIEIKERNPDASVICFYMDIRTYGRNFEEMYQQARDMGIKFIRGRVADCSPLINGSIQVRAENTLLGRPFQGIFDIVSLSLGMMPCHDANELSTLFQLPMSKDGFFKAENEDHSQHGTMNQGVFIAGTVSGLKPIRDCLLDAESVAGQVYSFLSHRGVK